MWSWCDKIATGYGSVDYVPRLRWYCDNDTGSFWPCTFCNAFEFDLNKFKLEGYALEPFLSCIDNAAKELDVVVERMISSSWWDWEYFTFPTESFLIVFSMFPKDACVACNKAGLPRNFNHINQWNPWTQTWGASGEKASFSCAHSEWWPTCPSSTSAHLGGWEMPQLKARCLRQGSWRSDNSQLHKFAALANRTSIKCTIYIYVYIYIWYNYTYDYVNWYIIYWLKRSCEVVAPIGSLGFPAFQLHLSQSLQQTNSSILASNNRKLSSSSSSNRRYDFSSHMPSSVIP